MSTQIGYVGTNGHPRITIRIRGTHPTEFAELDALVDTGFTRFLLLPIARALPLGLALYGIGDYSLADGSQISCFLAEGTVEVRPPSHSPSVASTVSAPADKPTATSESEIVTGVVVLGGDDVLVGMEFIRRLKKWLLVGSIVVLLDGEHVDIPHTPPWAE